MSPRLIFSLLFALPIAACAPAESDLHVAAPAAGARDVSSPIAVITPRDSSVASTTMTGAHHGNWRVVAADDPHDAALMAFSIQSNAGDATGSGDYVLFQPFCDVLADVPVAGDADCELIGLGAPFDRVEIDQARILLVFKPTADDVPHRLELRAEGDALVGDYVSEANRIRRAVIARHPPADEP